MSEGQGGVRFMFKTAQFININTYYKTKMNASDKALVVFQSKKIRRTWFKDEWHYSLEIGRAHV